MRSWNGKHPGVVPRVQSMSVHLVLACLSLGVVCCLLFVHLLVVFVGLQKMCVRAFARLRVGPTRSSIQDRYLNPTFRPASLQRALARESL